MTNLSWGTNDFLMIKASFKWEVSCNSPLSWLGSGCRYPRWSQGIPSIHDLILRIYVLSGVRKPSKMGMRCGGLLPKHGCLKMFKEAECSHFGTRHNYICEAFLDFIIASNYVFQIWDGNWVEDGKQQAPSVSLFQRGLFWRFLPLDVVQVYFQWCTTIVLILTG